MPGILNGDLGDGLKKFETYGPQRDYFNADYMWQISDTTAFLSDAYYDIHSGTFEQVDVGFSRTRWPDLTYYIGSRYLRNVQVLNEHGSNAFVFAASYVLDPRYTVVFSQQFDFDYGANVESNITLIRRYHRVFWSLTFSADASLDQPGGYVQYLARGRAGNGARQQTIPRYERPRRILISPLPRSLRKIQTGKLSTIFFGRFIISMGCIDFIVKPA